MLFISISGYKLLSDTVLDCIMMSKERGNKAGERNRQGVTQFLLHVEPYFNTKT